MRSTDNKGKQETSSEKSSLLPKKFKMPASYGTDLFINRSDSLGDLFVIPDEKLRKIILWNDDHQTNLSLRLSSKALKRIVDDTFVPLDPLVTYQMLFSLYQSCLPALNDASQKIEEHRKKEKDACIGQGAGAAICAVAMITAVAGGFFGHAAAACTSTVRLGALGGGSVSGFFGRRYLSLRCFRPKIESSETMQELNKLKLLIRRK